MRHRSAAKNFSRTGAHRRAMLRNMVINLFEHGRIRTTIQKAKAARGLAERIITLGKRGGLHDRRNALRKLGSTVAAKNAVQKAFGDLKDRFAERNGGYTRILRLPRTIRMVQADLPRGQAFNRSKYYGTRLGDDSTLVLWELCEAEIRKKERGQKKAARKPKGPKKDESPKEPKKETKSQAEETHAEKADGETKEKKAKPAKQK